jgi:hypothetical protein
VGKNEKICWNNAWPKRFKMQSWRPLTTTAWNWNHRPAPAATPAPAAATPTHDNSSTTHTWANVPWTAVGVTRHAPTPPQRPPPRPSPRPPRPPRPPVPPFAPPPPRVCANHPKCPNPPGHRGPYVHVWAVAVAAAVGPAVAFPRPDWVEVVEIAVPEPEGGPTAPIPNAVP